MKEARTTQRRVSLLFCGICRLILRRWSLKIQYFADNSVMLQNVAVAPRKGSAD